MPLRRLHVKLKRQDAMVVTRAAVSRKKLVYVLRANRKFKYPKGVSRVVYIGTSKRGVTRIAESAAMQAKKLLCERGVTELRVLVVVCGSRPGVKTWVELEDALLRVFKEEYGRVPHANTQGKNRSLHKHLPYFSRTRLRGILDTLA